MKNISVLLHTVFITTLLSLISSTSFAAGHGDVWNLAKDQSNINFVSVKKGSIGEVHSFGDFSGVIDHDKASISIDTASVDMLIPIRTERALKFLFESGAFPTIEIKSDVTAAIKGAKKGATSFADVPASLSMHGVTKDIILNVSITRNGKNTITVSSAKPVIIKAADYNMEAGVAKLGELVGKIPVVTSVPVNFVMTFKKVVK